jgi:hypothetical protein
MAEDGDAGDNGYCGGFTEGIERSWGFAMAFGGYPTLALYDRRKANAYGSFFRDMESLGLGVQCSQNSFKPHT